MKEEILGLLRSSLEAYGVCVGKEAAADAARRAVRSNVQKLNVTVTHRTHNGSLQCTSLRGSVYVPSRIVTGKEPIGRNACVQAKYIDAPKKGMSTWRAISFNLLPETDTSEEGKWIPVRR